jgi:hypothetical protein
MPNIGAVDQTHAMKSFRRHLEKVEHRKIRNENYVGHRWTENGRESLSAKWRKSYSKNNG